MHTIGAGDDRNIDPRVDEKFGPGRWDRVNNFLRFPGKRFQFPHRQIFFAELNVIHTGFRRQPDLVQDAAPPGRLAVAELRSVSDVVEEQIIKLSR